MYCQYAAPYRALIMNRSNSLMVYSIGIIAALFLLLGCLQSNDPIVDRWYSDKQVRLGAPLFAKYCARCHGQKAQGLVKNWKQKLADGRYPAPPLNGSGHAWHHALPQLLQIVEHGGSLYDGWMPAFDKVLNETEQYAVIASFQAYWDDVTYQQWQRRNLAAVSKE